VGSTGTEELAAKAALAAAEVLGTGVRSPPAVAPAPPCTGSPTADPFPPAPPTPPADPPTVPWLNSSLLLLKDSSLLNRRGVCCTVSPAPTVASCPAISIEEVELFELPEAVEADEDAEEADEVSDVERTCSTPTVTPTPPTGTSSLLCCDTASKLLCESDSVRADFWPGTTACPGGQ